MNLYFDGGSHSYFHINLQPSSNNERENREEKKRLNNWTEKPFKFKMIFHSLNINKHVRVSITIWKIQLNANDVAITLICMDSVNKWAANTCEYLLLFFFFFTIYKYCRSYTLQRQNENWEHSAGTILQTFERWTFETWICSNNTKGMQAEKREMRKFLPDSLGIDETTIGNTN